MTSSRDPTFIESLEAALAQREPIESPFAPPPTPRAKPQAPGTFPTPIADAILNPRMAEAMASEREAYLRRIAHTGGASARYAFKYDVFIVHRPPGACFECKILGQTVFKTRQAAIENNEDPSTIEPDFDFHHCPHHRRDEYVALMNKAFRKEIVLGSHREETLQSGAVQVCVSWGEPLHGAKKEPNTGPSTPPVL